MDWPGLLGIEAGIFAALLGALEKLLCCCCTIRLVPSPSLEARRTAVVLARRRGESWAKVENIWRIPTVGSIVA